MKNIIQYFLPLALLSLVSVQLFGNVQQPSKKETSSEKNRSKCIINQATAQKAIRAYSNLNQLPVGSAIDWNKIQKDGFIGDVKLLKCPSGGKYTILNVVPEAGKLAMRCSHEKDLNHRAKNTKNW